MNEAAALILGGTVSDRTATSGDTAARGEAAALLGKRGIKKARPATAKARRSPKR
jgi:hypothetical protein